MNCDYFGECGACRLYKNGYEYQLEEKVYINKDRFSNFFNGKISVFTSNNSHYRSRSEFKLWHIGDNIHYAMNHIDKKNVVLINSCPQVNQHIYSLMPKLIKEIKEKNIDFKLFGIDFLSSSDGEILVSLLYHKKLDSIWERLAKEISSKLNISIIGRSRKQKVIIGKDYIVETLKINAKTYKFNHIENSFTQPNARVNEKMIEWSLGELSSCKGDLLELYCGAGNFTIIFASIFDKVLATEISKSSINAAKNNMLLNNVKNIKFVRMSVEDFTNALDGNREYTRMKDIDISSYNIDTIFVDPPRSGMDLKSCEFVSRYKNILYISCNPKTLHSNLDILDKTHRVEKMAIFDQFPYTSHVEMGVKLVKRENI